MQPQAPTVPLPGGGPTDIPESVSKALRDPFDYALMLKDGTIIRFKAITRNGDWLHLSFGPGEEREKKSFGVFLPEPLDWLTFERGIDVRLSEVVWCCDTPSRARERA